MVVMSAARNRSAIRQVHGRQFNALDAIFLSFSSVAANLSCTDSSATGRSWAGVRVGRFCCYTRWQRMDGRRGRRGQGNEELLLLLHC